MGKNLSFAALFVFLLFHSCSNGQDAFPDSVTAAKSGNYKRIKGTKYFAVIPDSYKPLESLIRYQKDNSTYFQVIEIPATNFIAQKQKLSKKAMEAQGAIVDAHKSLKYNGFDAIYVEGPSKIDGETKLGIWFGDDTFSASVLCVCRTGDKESKEQLKNILKNSYYDKSYNLNPLELINFKVDETITGFKYAEKLGNIYFYTRDGKLDPNNPLGGSSVYLIMPFESDDFERSKEFLEKNITNFGTDFQISDVKKKELLVNGNRAFEITMEANAQDGSKNIMYNIVIYSETKQQAIIFSGTDGDNGIYSDKFKATGQSIKF